MKYQPFCSNVKYEVDIWFSVHHCNNFHQVRSKSKDEKPNTHVIKYRNTIGLDRIILSLESPLYILYLSFIYLTFFNAAFSNKTISCSKSWDRFQFGSAGISVDFYVCADKHLPMCRGTILLHIYRGPPYSFAQIIPLSPIFMGHRLNPILKCLLRHSYGFDQSNRVLRFPCKNGNSVNFITRFLKNSKNKLKPKVFSRIFSSFTCKMLKTA